MWCLPQQGAGADILKGISHLIYTSDNFTLLSDNDFIKIMHINSLGWNWQHQILCAQEKKNN